MLLSLIYILWGGVTFERTKLGTQHVVANCLRTTNKKQFSEMLLTWRRASENVDCYPKMGTQQNYLYLTFLKVKPETICLP